MIYLLIINVISLLICIIDKSKSIHNSYRISEKTLLFLSLIGGCFGMALGMNISHHKTKKLKFKLVYIFCILWLIILLYIEFRKRT